MEVIGEIFRGMFGVVPKAISLFFWILAAVLILPCVFVASAVYPVWEEWGEDF